MAPNSPACCFIHASIAGSRRAAPLNRSSSVFIVARCSFFRGPFFEVTFFGLMVHDGASTVRSDTSNRDLAAARTILVHHPLAAMLKSAQSSGKIRMSAFTVDSAKPSPGLLSNWLRLSGWIILAVQSLFVARLVYESTFLTCWNGPQMVGFALMHVGPSFFLL